MKDTGAFEGKTAAGVSHHVVCATMLADCAASTRADGVPTRSNPAKTLVCELKTVAHASVSLVHDWLLSALPAMFGAEERSLRVDVSLTIVDAFLLRDNAFLLRDNTSLLRDKIGLVGKSFIPKKLNWVFVARQNAFATRQTLFVA